MYRISGSNLFGQWLETDHIISDFRTINGKHKNDLHFNINSSKLLQVNWSYNIFQFNKAFYVTGDCNGTENQLIKIDIPEDCDASELESNLSVAGTDYYLILINKKLNNLWIIDLQKEKETKKINLNLEQPLEKSIKILHVESFIIKVAVSNNSCLYLTSDGKVYQGTLPSLLDTRHCVGKVCDIRCGYEHYMLLTDMGRVYTWGNGRRLQLGHGTLDNLDTPTEVEALAGIHIDKIRAGGWHCLALSEFGDLYTWGWNDTGQLGVRHSDTKGVLNKEGIKSYPLPRLVDILDEDGKELSTNVKDIGCGSRHSALILEDNTVWTTGNNKYGQLGFSPDAHPTVNYYKKAFQCTNSTVIECGPWSTVLVERKSAMI